MFVWAAIVIVGLFAIFLFFVHVMRARRRLWHRPDRSYKTAFDLGQLHAMRDSGQITPAEFDRLFAILAKPARESQFVPGPRGFDVLPPDKGVN